MIITYPPTFRHMQHTCQHLKMEVEIPTAMPTKIMEVPLPIAVVTSQHTFQHLPPTVELTNQPYVYVS